MTQMPSTPSEPQGAPVGERPGELLDRFLARLIDGILLVVVYAVLSAIFRGMFLDGLIYSTSELLIYNLVTSVVFAAVALGYYAYLDSTRGQTVGKMVMKLEVHGPDGGRPTVEQSLRRNILYAFGLIAIIPVLGWILGSVAQLVGVIMIAVGINSDTARRQAWHDRFAGGTYVVKLAG